MCPKTIAIENQIFEAELFVRAWQNQGWPGEPISLEMNGSVNYSEKQQPDYLSTFEWGTDWSTWRNRGMWDAKWITRGRRYQLLRIRRLRADRKRRGH